MWELIFAALMVWFVVRSVQSIQRFGLHKPHEAIHAVDELRHAADVPVSRRGDLGGCPGRCRCRSQQEGARLDPGLGFLLAVIFFASAVFTLASPVKGVSHHGSHAFAYATSVAVGATASGDSGSGSSQHDSLQVGGLEAVVTTPWLEDASHVVMCFAMGFMLILML